MERIWFGLEEVFENLTSVVGMRAHEKGLEVLFHSFRHAAPSRG